MNANAKFVMVDHRGPITIVTLNRPEVMNAINIEMHYELQATFDAFAADAGQQICIITGAGQRAFCAGSDLKAAAVAGGHPKYPESGYAGLIERFDCPKPFIAAVNGVALGGGFEVALACDLIIAAENASFGLPEPLVGAVALGGGVHRLPRQIGLKAAMGIMLTSRRVDAEEALRLSLINERTSQDELLPAALRWSEQILRASPMSIRATKETAHRSLDEPSLQEAMRKQETFPAFAAWRGSADAKEGPRAFAEKRPPKWQAQ